MVHMDVYDVLGREVARLVSEYEPAGDHSVELSASRARLASGSYYYRIRAGGFEQTKKMTLVK